MAHRSFDFLTELPAPFDDGNWVVRNWRSTRRFFAFIGLALIGTVSALARKLSGADHRRLYKPYTWFCRNIHRAPGIRVTGSPTTAATSTPSWCRPPTRSSSSPRRR